MFRKNSIVSVIGGSGFVGMYVVRHLAQLGVRIQIISRNAKLKSSCLKVSGNVGQITLINCSINNFAKLENYLKTSDYIINLVGIMNGKGNEFDKIHHLFPKNLARLCAKYKIKKLIHLSALGVENIPTSKYALSKIQGEKSVLLDFNHSIVIKPSVIFGPEDNFINKYNTISKLFPILFYPTFKNTSFQPVYVEDIAKAIVTCITQDIYNNSIIELAGPKKYTFKELLQSMLTISGRKRILLPMPKIVIYLIAFFTSKLPKPILTFDQIKLLKHENISTNNGFSALNIKPSNLEKILPSYIN